MNAAATRINRIRRQLTPTWTAAWVALLGCALPLLLGQVSGHPGFVWAALGAYHASRAHPLHRFGMLRMVLLTAFGAYSVALGFWAAGEPLISLGLFALYALILVWLQRLGNEAGKMGMGLLICLCLGNGQYIFSSFDNPHAIAALFMLGGAWATLLAFFLRGLHGLRMWPHTPRLLSILRVMRRHAQLQPLSQWVPYAIVSVLVLAVAGSLVAWFELPNGYWLTMMILPILHLGLLRHPWRALSIASAALLLGVSLIVAGYSLNGMPVIMPLLLLMVFLSRAFQAKHYGMFFLQSMLCYLLITESLSSDWSDPQTRLTSLGIGTGLAFLVIAIMALQQRLQRHKVQSDSLAADGPQA